MIAKDQYGKIRGNEANYTTAEAERIIAAGVEVAEKILKQIPLSGITCKCGSGQCDGSCTCNK